MLLRISVNYGYLKVYKYIHTSVFDIHTDTHQSTYVCVYMYICVCAYKDNQSYIHKICIYIYIRGR